MNDDQLLRYSRRILLDEMGIGAGKSCWPREPEEECVGAGLELPVALYLGSAGVGRIGGG
jgi:hypothetical protein